VTRIRVTFRVTQTGTERDHRIASLAAFRWSGWIGSDAADAEDELANAMRAGSLAIACLADVDGPILGRNMEGVLCRDTHSEPGEAYRHHLD
jgi:hypothetical protein